MRTLLFFTILLFSTVHAAEAECPRIISQSPYITKSLQWLGLESCIVGVSRYDQLERPRTGGILDPDAEAIASLDPDLIFTSDWTGGERIATMTPEGATAHRLHGFDSMNQVEENLRIMASAAALADGQQRVQRFSRQWREASARIGGGGRRVLLLSSCSGMPYSFGKKRWLSELFTQAGFHVVETVDKIRHIRAGEEIATLNRLIDELKPELLFIFERSSNPQCQLIKPETPLRIINLDGEKFLHPAPVILDGLEELQTHRNAWLRP